MRIAKPVLFILTLVLLTFTANAAFACKCPKNLDPVKKAEMIFWGKAESIERRGSRDRVTFKVEELFKGDERPAVKVYTDRFHHECGVRFTAGKSYMIYARAFPPRGVATDLCWGSYQIDEAPSDHRTPRLRKVEATALEKTLRGISKGDVLSCANETRVREGGFGFAMSPDGDPVHVPPSEGRVSARDKEFAACVADAFIDNPKTPIPDRPVHIEGWFDSNNSRAPILIDELDCDEDCPDWATQMKNKLLAMALPLSDEDAKNKANALEGEPGAEIEAAEARCRIEGVAAIASEVDQKGGSRTEMIFRCAMDRGEFDKAVEFDAGAPDQLAEEVAAWAKANAGSPPLPIRTGDLTFTKHWFSKHGPKNAGSFRALRAMFLDDTGWENRPAMLEAFAESILSDDDAPRGMRDMAALAYRKAALLTTDPAATAYRELARKASTAARVDAMQGQLDETFQEAVRRREEEAAQYRPEAPPQDMAEVSAEDAEPPAPEIDTFTLLLAAVMGLVMLAGAYFKFFGSKR